MSLKRKKVLFIEDEPDQILLELIPKPMLKPYNYAMSRPGERGPHGVAWRCHRCAMGADSGPPTAGPAPSEGRTSAT